MQVIDHEPKINSVNVPRNVIIKVKFDIGIIGSTVTGLTFSINDSQYLTSVPGSYGVEFSEGVMNTIVFTPDIKLLPNNKYRVFVYGKPNSIVGVDNSQLSSTYIFDFTTGILELNQDGTPGIPPDYINDETIPIFKIVKVSPNHQQPNIKTDLSQIDIEFNGNITSTIEELNDLISLDIKDVLF